MEMGRASCRLLLLFLLLLLLLSPLLLPPLLLLLRLLLPRRPQASCPRRRPAPPSAPGQAARCVQACAHQAPWPSTARMAPRAGEWCLSAPVNKPMRHPYSQGPGGIHSAGLWSLPWPLLQTELPRRWIVLDLPRELHWGAMSYELPASGHAPLSEPTHPHPPIHAHSTHSIVKLPRPLLGHSLLVPPLPISPFLPAATLALRLLFVCFPIPPPQSSPRYYPLPWRLPA